MKQYNHKVIMKQIIFLSLILIFCKAQAQQTLIYSEPDANYKYGVELFDKEKYAAAKSYFEAILSDKATNWNQQESLVKINSEYFVATSSARLQQDDAPFLLEKFIEENPESIKSELAKYELGKMYFQQKKYKKAIPLFQSTDSYYLTVEEKSQMQYYLGYSYFQAKKYPQAKSAFKQIQNLNNKYSQSANYYVGYISYEQKKYDEAIAAFKRIENVRTYSKIVPLHITQIYYQQERYDELLEYAEPLSNNPRISNKAEINHIIGQTYFQKENYEKAVPYLETFIRGLKNIRDDDHYMLGYSAYQAKEYQKAIDAFKRIASEDNKMGQNASYLMADSHLRLKEKRKARTSFKQAASQDFDLDIKEISAFNYAKLSYEMNYHQVSLKALQDFIKDYPNSKYRAEANQVLSELLLSTKNYKQALVVLEKMDRSNPTIKEAYQKVNYYRGVETYNAGKYKESIGFFNKVAQNPVDKKIETLSYFWKAEALYKSKNYDGSRFIHSKFQKGYQSNYNLSPENSLMASHYTVGYCFFNVKNYKNAQKSFTEAYNGINKSNSFVKNNAFVQDILPDLTLRLADVSFAINDYNSALRYYNKIISSGMAGGDYATFQKAIILGLGRKSNEKIKAFQQLIASYPNSAYVDDAYMQLASHYFNQNNYNSALNELDKFIQKQPKSLLVPQALLTKALIYGNQGNHKDALATYKKVAETYPKTQEGRDALPGIRDSYIELNDVDGYQKYLRDKKGIFGNVNLDKNKLDELSYKATRKVYDQGGCTASLPELNKYLTKYPNGIHATEIHFLRGECRLNNDKADLALPDFEFVINQGRNFYSENAYYFASDILFQKQDFAKALKYYEQLEGLANSKRNLLEAYFGIMRCSYKTQELTKTSAAIEKVLAYEYATDYAKREANFYKGNIALSKGNLGEAKVIFEDIYAGEKNELAAEAKYHIAEIEFKEDKLDDCQTTIFALIDEVPFYDYWLTKAFILLSDTYVKQDNLFQAKATLESIIENHKGEELLNIAKQKLAEVERLEE